MCQLTQNGWCVIFIPVYLKDSATTRSNRNDMIFYLNQYLQFQSCLFPWFIKVLTTKKTIPICYSLGSWQVDISETALPTITTQFRKLLPPQIRRHRDIYQALAACAPLVFIKRALRTAQRQCLSACVVLFVLRNWLPATSGLVKLTATHGLC